MNAMDALEQLANIWLKEHPEIVEAIWNLPLNVQTEDFEARGRSIILDMVKQAWMEGNYEGATHAKRNPEALK